MKEPAMLQSFYKLVWWKHPVELTVRNLRYVFEDDAELWSEIKNKFNGSLEDDNETFYLSAEPYSGNFMLFNFVEGDVNPLFFSTITDEQLYKLKSITEVV